MIEHGMYFGKNDFYNLIKKNGGVWNDSKERPIVCLIKSKESNSLFWAIPVGNYEHRDEKAKARIQKYLNYDKKDIRSSFYHVGNTNEKSIFFISDVVPFTDKYIDREYLNKSKNIHIIKNKNLLSELERKLKRILDMEKQNPNYFRQHITDLKSYLLAEIEAEKSQLRIVAMQLYDSKKNQINNEANSEISILVKQINLLKNKIEDINTVRQSDLNRAKIEYDAEIKRIDNM